MGRTGTYGKVDMQVEMEVGIEVEMEVEMKRKETVGAPARAPAPHPFGRGGLDLGRSPRLSFRFISTCISTFSSTSISAFPPCCSSFHLMNFNSTLLYPASWCANREYKFDSGANTGWAQMTTEDQHDSIFYKVFNNKFKLLYIYSLWECMSPHQVPTYEHANVP